MKSYLADSNIFLRLFLQDNSKQSKKSASYISDAKDGKIEIVVSSEIIPEIEYVLRKVYKASKGVVIEHLSGIIKTSYIKVEKRNIWIEAINLYSNNNIDLIDALLYAEAKDQDLAILSFDEDFKKIKIK